MNGKVALLVSAWIETVQCSHGNRKLFVALLVSAWIETTVTAMVMHAGQSRTPRECVD